MNTASPWPPLAGGGEALPARYGVTLVNGMPLAVDVTSDLNLAREEAMRLGEALQLPVHPETQIGEARAGSWKPPLWIYWLVGLLPVFGVLGWVVSMLVQTGAGGGF